MLKQAQHNEESNQFVFVGACPEADITLQCNASAVKLFRDSRGMSWRVTGRSSLISEDHLVSCSTGQGVQI